MQNYYFFIWLLFMWLVEQSFPEIQREEVVVGGIRIRPKILFAIVVFAPLCIQAAFRGDVGDTYSYKIIFKNLPDNFPALIAYIPSVSKDPGFTLFSGIIKVIFGPNETLYFTIIAIIQSLILVFFLRKYSCNYLVSVFLFFASTDYSSWMENGIRQFLAVVIILAGTKYYLNKDWLKSVLIILIASLFHQSALIMLLWIVIAQGAAWNKKSLIFVLVSLVAVVFVNQFTDILNTAMADTQYSSMVDDWTQWGDDGTNMLRVLVYSVPALFSLIGLKRIRYKDDPLINLCTNFSIITAGIYLISMVTSGVFIGRLPIYTSMYGYILLPWEIRHLFTKRSQKIVLYLMILLYLGFYSYQIWIG